MADPERTIHTLSKLNALGVRISIDDFGTGYSSLSRLHQLPADVLKIDRSFTVRIGADNEGSEIVRLIITLAHTLRLRVVAEGIDTTAQLDFLSSLGCEFGQGYLFSKPVDEQGARQMLESRRSLLPIVNLPPRHVSLIKK
jgi:EAL domain-containing protein (putative c-di-GMP-specific phosphodiesterase class I)